MLSNTKQGPPLSKSRLSPLFILSKVRKNSQLIHQKQTALNILQREQAKINNRYGQCMNRYKTEGNDSNQRNQSNQETSTTAKKISDILKKSFKRDRFHSVDRNRSRDVSPYLSQLRKSMKSQDNSQKIIKVPEQAVTKPTIDKLINKSDQHQSTQTRKIAQPHQLTNRSKIYLQFSNLCRISQILNLNKKKNDRQIISCIKSYILDDQGDSSQILLVYQEDRVKQEIKLIMFQERILMILIVDHIINRKFRLTEVFVKMAIKIIIKFYRLFFRDLVQERVVDAPTMFSECADVQKLLSSEEDSGNTSFGFIIQCMEAKLKACFKFSRDIQKFYKQHLKKVQQLTINMSYYKLLEFYSHNLLGQCWMNWNIEFLQACPSPYLHYEPQKKYTLVLDLDQTLIHYKSGTMQNNYQGQFLIRPHMFQFLQQMSQFFQLGIFTCSLPEYADLIINHMKHINFRLYRHHTIKLNGEYIKDLSRLGRNLSKVLLVDNLEQNFRLQKTNGVHVRSWYGDRADDVLRRLGNQLKRVVGLGVDDLREVPIGKFL